MSRSFLGPFNITREQMVPPFNESTTLAVLDEQALDRVKAGVLEEREHWLELIQKSNYKLSADPDKFGFLYDNLASALHTHLQCEVRIKTKLDFFLFDQFDSRWEKEPSGFIHNDWANYAKCMQEFASPEDVPHYHPEQAIALVLAITLPEVGSGIELYDAFHGEKVDGKRLIAQREAHAYSLRKYTLGHATLFCPFQFHSGHCAEAGTLKPTDTRMVLVAFLIKFDDGQKKEWHVFRMCKGATLEYGDESLYGLPEDILDGTREAQNAD